MKSDVKFILIPGKLFTEQKISTNYSTLYTLFKYINPILSKGRKIMHKNIENVPFL